MDLGKVLTTHKNVPEPVQEPLFIPAEKPVPVTVSA